jgi:hypothetical protein
MAGLLFDERLSAQADVKHSTRSAAWAWLDPVDSPIRMRLCSRIAISI